MNKQEFNRDVKRLRKRYHGDESKDYGSDFQKEFSRLYNADSNFQYANKDSILTLLRINHRFRYVPLHVFGLNVDI